MAMQHLTMNRRELLGRGTRMTGLGLAGVAFLPRLGMSSAATAVSAKDDLFTDIEDIIQAQGMYSNGVFSIEIDRDDITDVTLRGVPILPSFQINGTLYFQKIGDGGSRVILNGDMALKASEIDAFIDQLLKHNLVFQAEHQHFYDFSPMVWFIHFRAVGDGLEIARAVKAALNTTSTPFPQTSPSNPTTPLPVAEIGKIIGASPTVGAHGVVNLDVPREDPIFLGGIQINPYLNVATSISFEPYGGGENAAAVVDFALIPSEINPVMKVMRKLGWDIGCLYNQETDEKPQLFRISLRRGLAFNSRGKFAAVSTSPIRSSCRKVELFQGAATLGVGALHDTSGLPCRHGCVLRLS